jgi:hypothetical protein
VSRTLDVPPPQAASSIPIESKITYFIELILGHSAQNAS